jgi:hypothetical protein
MKSPCSLSVKPRVRVPSNAAKKGMHKQVQSPSHVKSSTITGLQTALF